MRWDYEIKWDEMVIKWDEMTYYVMRIAFPWVGPVSHKYETFMIFSIIDNGEIPPRKNHNCCQLH